jgi:thymidylate kinase
MLLVFEWPDFSGKTTVSKEMARRLGAEWKCFPDRTTPIGGLIDGYLKRMWRVQPEGMLPGPVAEELLNPLVFQGLQFANRLEHLDRLRQAREGRALVLDRYWQSGFAYGKLDGLDGEWLIQASQNFPQATLNILLDAPLPLLLERRAIRGGELERYDRDDFLKRLCAHYHQVWSWGRAHQGQDTWKVVDSSGSKQETAERVWQVLLDSGCATP